MAWPTRTFVCLDCRTLLPDAACPAGGRHRVTSIAKHESRERLLDTVWGPKSVRERLVEAGKVGTGSAAASTSFHACDLLSVFEIDVFALVLIVVGVFWFFGSLLVSLFRKRRVRRSGRAASAPGLQVGRMKGVLGTVRATRTEVDPLTRRSSVAYAAELADVNGIMLRDSATIGFDVELVTGETVRVPPGLVSIDMQRASEVASDLEAYREKVDPLRSATTDFEALPGDEVRLQLVQPGDTVEFLGEVERVPLGHAAGYRDAGPSVLVPRGLVRLRPC
jgi:hypothetical protein